MNDRAPATTPALLHTVRSGAGSTVVVLHGFTGSSEAIGGLCDVLAQAHDVVAVDLPGHGLSPVPDERATMGDVVASLSGTISTLGTEHVHLVGYSMGGRVALSLASEDARRLRSLVLIGTSPGITGGPAREDRLRADQDLADRIVEHGMERFAADWASQPLLLPVSARGRRASSRMAQIRMRNDAGALAAALRVMGTGAMTPLQSRLATLDLPVALIAGEADGKYRSIAEDMAARLPAATTYVIAGAGHAAHLDDPEMVGRITLEFLADVETDRR